MSTATAVACGSVEVVADRRRVRLSDVNDGAGTPAEPNTIYDDPQVVASYLVHRHSGLSSPNEVMEGPAFRRALGDIEGKSVVDLGCGDGTFAAELTAAGCASYLGVDASVRMIDLAADRYATESVRFVVGDIANFAFSESGVDVVTARMSLHYVADIDAVFERVARCLEPGGRFIFSVVHPVITSNEVASDGPRTNWTVDRYFETGPRLRSWFGATATWYHRTIEQYITAVQRAGFGLDSLSECEPSEALLHDRPDELERRRRVPLILVIAATKRDA